MRIFGLKIQEVLVLALIFVTIYFFDKHFGEEEVKKGEKKNSG